MHEYEYVSSLSSYIQDFLHEKRALGYKYRTEEYVLRRFDSYWYRSGNPESINQENLAGWLQQSPTEGKSRLSQRICTVRLLILFMKGLGINSCVPYEKIRRAKPAVHIMSSDEIISLFNVIDAYFPSREKRDTARMAREYGVLFRLILTVHGGRIRCMHAVMTFISKEKTSTFMTPKEIKTGSYTWLKIWQHY